MAKYQLKHGSWHLPHCRPFYLGQRHIHDTTPSLRSALHWEKCNLCSHSCQDLSSVLLPCTAALRGEMGKRGGGRLALPCVIVLIIDLQLKWAMMVVYTRLRADCTVLSCSQPMWIASICGFAEAGLKVNLPESTCHLEYIELTAWNES